MVSAATGARANSLEEPAHARVGRAQRRPRGVADDQHAIVEDADALPSANASAMSWVTSSTVCRSSC